MSEKLFEQRKKSFYERLIKESTEGKVDFDIKDFLKEFNEKVKDFYTTSSCSGRIILAETPRLALVKSRHMFKFIEKWHRPITYSELMKALNRCKECENIWLLVRAPIIHFVTNSLENAVKLLKIAQKTGFKHSGIISIRENEITIEIQGDDRLDIPLIKNKIWIINPVRLKKLIDIANEVLITGKMRLIQFIKELEIEIMKKTFDNTFNYLQLPYLEFLEKFPSIIDEILNSKFNSLKD